MSHTMTSRPVRRTGGYFLSRQPDAEPAGAARTGWWRRRRYADLSGAAFAAVILLAEVSPAFPHHPSPKIGWWLGGVAVTLATALAALAVRSVRHGRWLRYLPLLMFLVAVQMLRAADGNGAAGFGPLLILPVVWYALYGSRVGLCLALTGVAAVQFGPLIFVGPPQYPVTLWRGAVLWLLVLGLVGLAVHRLVAAVRHKSAELAVSEEQFRRAFSDAPTGVALIGNVGDDLGLFLQVNRSLATLLGRAEEELVGRSVLEFTHPADREATEQRLLAPPELQVGRTIEKRYLHSAGRVVRMKITYTRIESGTGGDPCVVAHYEDITDRDGEPQFDSGGAAGPAAAPVDIDAVLRAALTSIEPVARRRDLALQADFNVAGAQVWGDVAQLDRVVRTLFENTMRLTPSGGAIDAQARVRGGVVVIEVTESEGSTSTLALPVRAAYPLS